jgi:hypothetical protein
MVRSTRLAAVISCVLAASCASYSNFSHGAREAILCMRNELIYATWAKDVEIELSGDVTFRYMWQNGSETEERFRVVDRRIENGRFLFVSEGRSELPARAIELVQSRCNVNEAVTVTAN